MGTPSSFVSSLAPMATSIVEISRAAIATEKPNCDGDVAVVAAVWSRRLFEVADNEDDDEPFIKCVMV